MKRKPKAAPVIVKSGNIVMKIYPGTNIQAGKRYPLHTLAYYEDGRRIRRAFADMAEAKAEAGKIAERLDRGDHDAARISGADAQAFATAKRELAPLGVSVLEAVRAYVSAINALPAGTPLLTAVQYFTRHHTTGVKRKLVGDVVAEFIEAKRQDGASYRYLKTLCSMLEPAAEKGRRRKSFGDAFRTYIDSVSGTDIDAWLRARGVGARTRRNMTLTIRTLFNFAQTKKYLPKNTPTEADDLALPKKRGGVIGIFTPNELVKLLAGSEDHPARDEYVLWLAIGAFAGLRTAEMLRIKWGDHVKPGQGIIQITDDIAKTSARRVVKIRPTLAAWLAGHERKAGLVFEARADERAHAYAERLGVEWKPNALRHSFISYLVMKTQDIPAVSYEAGNSVGIIKTNYMELVTPEDAERWFVIMPPTRPKNIVTMKGAA